MPVVKNEGVVTDTGTGAYSNPSEPTTHQSSRSEGSTGSESNPSEPTTYNADPRGGDVAPTGAVEGRQVETFTQWPGNVKAVEEATVENKAVSASKKTTKRATKN